MSDSSIFGEVHGAGRFAPSPEAAKAKRSNPSNGLFGLRLIPQADRPRTAPGVARSLS